MDVFDVDEENDENDADKRHRRQRAQQQEFPTRHRTRPRTRLSPGVLTHARRGQTWRDWGGKAVGGGVERGEMTFNET